MATSNSTVAESDILDTKNQESSSDESELNSTLEDREEVVSLANKATELEKNYIESRKQRKSASVNLIIQNNEELFNAAEELLREKLDEVALRYINPEEKKAILTSIKDQSIKLDSLITLIKDKNLQQSIKKGIDNQTVNYSGAEKYNRQYLRTIIYILRSATALEQERLTEELDKANELLQQKNYEVGNELRLRLEEDNNGLALAEARERIESLQINSTQLENKIKSLEELIKQQTNLIEETEATNTTINLENRKTTDDLRNTIKNQNTSLQQQAEFIKVVSEAEKLANTQLDTAKHRIQELVAKNTEAATKLENLTADLKNTESELENCGAAYKALEDQLKTATDEVNRRQTEYTDNPTNTFESNDQKLTTIGRDLTEVKDIVYDNRSLLIQTTKSIRENTHRTIDRTGISLADELSVLEEQNTNQSEEEDQYEDSIYLGTRETSSLPRLKETIELLEKALETKGTEHKTATEKLKEADQVLKSQQSEINKQNQTITELRKRVSEFEEEQDIMANAELARKFDQIISRDEKKEIPLYDGESDDVHKWIQQAERVSNNNSWAMDQKIRYFSDRLKGEALEWHNEYMEKPLDDSSPPKPIPKVMVTYGTWKHNFMKRFEDEADLERIKNHLKTLKQKTGQNVKSYIAIINRLYNRVNGKGVQLPDRASLSEIALCRENYNLRDKEKLEILLSGLTHSLKEAIWVRMPANRTYDSVCKLAGEVESILLNKELTDNKGISALVAGISLHEQEQDLEINKQRIELANLQKQIGEIRLTETFNQVMDKSPLIAAVEKYDNQNQTPEGRKENNNYYTYPRDRSRSRDTDRDYRREYSRSASPGPPRYLKQNQERDFSTDRQSRPDQSRSRFPDNWRERSLSNSRVASQERPQSTFNNYTPRREHDTTGQQPNTARDNFRFQRPYQATENQFRGPGQRIPFPRQVSFDQSNQQTAGDTVICYFCKRPGHIQAKCKTRLRLQNRRTQNMGQQHQVMN